MIKYFTAIIKYSMYARTCTLLLTYPTQTPLLFSGSRLQGRLTPPPWVGDQPPTSDKTLFVPNMKAQSYSLALCGLDVVIVLRKALYLYNAFSLLILSAMSFSMATINSDEK